MSASQWTGKEMPGHFSQRSRQGRRSDTKWRRSGSLALLAPSSPRQAGNPRDKLGPLTNGGKKVEKVNGNEPLINLDQQIDELLWPAFREGDTWPREQKDGASLSKLKTKKREKKREIKRGFSESAYQTRALGIRLKRAALSMEPRTYTS